MNIPSNIITLILGILITLISLWYGQNHGLMPISASENADQVDDLFNLMMTIATGLFLLVEGVLVFCIFKFRRKKGDTADGPYMEGNVPLEIVWTAIPTVIVFILAIYSFEVYNSMGGVDPEATQDPGTQQIAYTQEVSNFDSENSWDENLLAMDPSEKQIALGLGSPAEDQSEAPLEINVQGLQYAWIFNYVDSGVSSGDLHIPVNRKVKLNISAFDVIHAFWVPELRLKQDAIPGREAQVVFRSNLEGDYPIICAELCGAFHGGMKSVLYVESQEDYENWVQENTFASEDNPDETVAFNPLSESKSPHQQILTSYAEEMGVEESTLTTLKHHQLQD